MNRRITWPYEFSNEFNFISIEHLLFRELPV
jgi:hypothetical protein